MMPLWPLNNTMLYGTNGYCDPSPEPWSREACVTFRGGAYDSVASKTRQQADPDSFAADKAGDGMLGAPSYPRVAQIADSLRLNANVTLEQFPLGIAQSGWGAGYAPMMGLGLGGDSTLLRTLESSKLVASRSWGFFWGRTAPGQPPGKQLDGSLILGGYDRAKVSGRGFTQALTAPGAVEQCPSQIVVAISDIVLNFGNGTDQSIFPGSRSTAISACITPSLPALMRLPLDPYFDNMMYFTEESIFAMDRSVGIYFWNMRYRSGHRPYNGDLTITLQSGLSVRIPNDQLVMPHTAIDHETGEVYANTTAGPDLVIDSLQDVEADKMAHLGWQFLTAAYLLVNQDANQFTLWAANPTASQDLVAVDAAGAEVTDWCLPGTEPVAGPGEAGDIVPVFADAESRPGRLSEGTIAGITFGVVAAIVGIGVLCLYLFRRRRQRAQTANTQARSLGAPGIDGSYQAAAQEDKVDGTCRHELPSHGVEADRAMKYELPG